MSDIALLARLAPLLGAAPSGPTVRRALDLAGVPAMLDRIAAARAHAWALVVGIPWPVIVGKGFSWGNSVVGHHPLPATRRFRGG